MPIPSIRTFSHLGICVSDLDKAMRFYCEGLGFKHIVTFPVGNEAGVTMEITDDIVLDSVIIRRDGVSIELLGFKSPKPKPVIGRRPMTQVGLTHLSLLVDDVEAVAAHAVAHGGTLVPETRTVSPAGDFIFVLDPDGTRVELMRLNAGPVPTGE